MKNENEGKSHSSRSSFMGMPDMGKAGVMGLYLGCIVVWKSIDRSRPIGFGWSPGELALLEESPDTARQCVP